MQKIILDTNVVVSAMIQRSFPHFVLMNLYLERKVELCISENILAEYIEVLGREKFSKFPDFKLKADNILVDIENNASLFYPKRKVRKIKDPDDDMFLELAQECKADFIITGNTNDFTITSFRKTKIVTPREYWEYFRPQ